MALVKADAGCSVEDGEGGVRMGRPRSSEGGKDGGGI